MKRKLYVVEREMKPAVYFTSKKDAVDYLLSIGYAYYDEMNGYYKPVDGSSGYYSAILYDFEVEESDV